VTVSIIYLLLLTYLVATLAVRTLLLIHLVTDLRWLVVFDVRYTTHLTLHYGRCSDYVVTNIVTLLIVDLHCPVTLRCWLLFYVVG